jgi:uncharacterized protein involved in type VI secretion and phage assembly
VATDQNGNRHYGKYRGKVTNNVDPMQLGRIQAEVPDVLGANPSSWAMPSAPAAGAQMGTYFVPPVGAGVWVEFEQGDTDYPIWSGCWWATAEVPSLALAAPASVSHLLVQTAGQNVLQVSDAPGPTGGLMLKSSGGAAITINDTGITITNGKGATIALSGSTVTINNGALTIS